MRKQLNKKETAVFGLNCYCRCGKITWFIFRFLLQSNLVSLCFKFLLFVSKFLFYFFFTCHFASNTFTFSHTSGVLQASQTHNQGDVGNQFDNRVWKLRRDYYFIYFFSSFFAWSRFPHGALLEMWYSGGPIISASTSNCPLQTKHSLSDA